MLNFGWGMWWTLLLLIILFKFCMIVKVSTSPVVERTSYWLTLA